MFKRAEPNEDQKKLLVKLDFFHKNKPKPIFVYSGPPGSGKTWVIRLFFEEHHIDESDFITCAYSGKAANVLAMNGLPAKTIHSLIYNMELVQKTNPTTNEVTYVPTFVKKPQLDHDYKYIVVDELSMVPDNIMADLLSFGIPIIGMGDINQLPPVFGCGSYIARPDFTLTEIMRQAWDSPIIKMSQYVLHNVPLGYGSYGNNCNVLRTVPIGRNLLGYDCILCNRNATRNLINEIFRSDIMKFTKFGKKKPLVHVGEKLVCKQNCWSRSLNGIYLTNGTIGQVDYIDDEHTNSNKITIDFRPDYSDTECFNNVAISPKYLGDNTSVSAFNFGVLNFDYAYALTVHSAQGSQFNKILYIDDGFSGDREIKKKLKYTAITRAVNSIDIVDSSCFAAYEPYNT
jgi:ATP-dependent exoDNAse (exonuclease V) alpha subunit